MRKSRHKSKLAFVSSGNKKSRPVSGIGVSSSNSSKRFFSFRGFKNSTTNTIASRVKALHEDISKGTTNLGDLFKKGYSPYDFIEAFGAIGTIDYMIRNNAKADFDFEATCNDKGITDVSLRAAGATGTNRSLDFSNFSTKNLFTQNDRVRFTQLYLVGKEFAKAYPEPQKRPKFKFANLRHITKLNVTAEISNLYNSMSDFQKDNVRKLTGKHRDGSKYLGLLDSGVFHWVLGLWGRHAEKSQRSVL